MALIIVFSLYETVYHLCGFESIFAHNFRCVFNGKILDQTFSVSFSVWIENKFTCAQMQWPDFNDGQSVSCAWARACVRLFVSMEIDYFHGDVMCQQLVFDAFFSSFTLPKSFSVNLTQYSLHKSTQTCEKVTSHVGHFSPANDRTSNDQGTRRKSRKRTTVTRSVVNENWI